MGIDYRETLPAKEAYAALFASTGWNEEYGFTPEELYAAIRSSWYAVSAYNGAQLVGFGRVIADGVHHALIVDLIVLPDHQGHGIGSVLLERLIAQCRAHRIRDVQLFCARGKAGFYERHGFAARPADAPGMQLRQPPG